MSESAYRATSFWFDSIDRDSTDDLTARPALPGDRSADVVVVGAGYTGLWCAYYLAMADPTLRIVVLEAQIAGFGASGRNGGWCSALLPMSPAAIQRDHGSAAAVAFQRAMNDTVDEVGARAAAAGIDCHFDRAGYLCVARNPAQVSRLKSAIEEERTVGLPDQTRWLDRNEARQFVAADGVLGGAYTEHCAALHPARLARGLARAVERLGVTIFEHTAVTSIEPGVARTRSGDVRAEVVIRATEAFTPALAGLRRSLIPLYSLMIATAPLTPAQWSEIGWNRRVTFNDGRRLLVYGQRTADGRIAFGGRGAPYHFGSAVKPRFDRDDDTFAALRRSLVELFPALDDVEITHSWGGPLGVARDWRPSVGLDRTTGLGWAGGYVGDGVSTTNLAGRTLCDLVRGVDSDLTRLPWVAARSRPWEPEPLRWIGVSVGRALPVTIDRYEAERGREPRARSWLLARLTGH